MAGTKRIPLHRAAHQIITPRAVALFAALLTRKGRDDAELSLELHRELDRRPWDEFVEYIDSRDRGPDGDLLRALQAAVKAVRSPRRAKSDAEHPIDGASRSA
jgi:hypothetical protein